MKRNKKLISALLTLVLTLSLLPVCGLAAEDSSLTDYNIDSTVSWSFPTIDGGTVTNTTYSGKVQILIFFRANGDCDNSNNTINSLANADWIKSDNIEIIAVGCGEPEENGESVKDHVISYKEQHANTCDDIVFCYATSSQMCEVINKLQLLIECDTSQILYAVNYVFDSQGRLRFTWQGDYSSYNYLSALSALDIAKFNLYEVKIRGEEDYDSAYAILESLNSYREENGRSALTMDKDLLATAMQRAAEIAIYYSHVRPDTRSCFSAFPSNFSNGTCRENIAVKSDSVATVMTGWKNSTEPKANMLAEDNQSVGIGAFVDSDGTRYWVQVFSSLSGTPEDTPTTGMKKATKDITAVSETLNLTVSPASAELFIGQKSQFTVSNANTAWKYSTPNIILTYAFAADDRIVSVSIGDDGTATVTPVAVGDTTVELGIAGKSGGTPLTISVDVSVKSEKNQLAESMFQVDTEDEVYDGNAKAKTIQSDLIAEKDYTVAYSNNINAGTATITITGAGTYSGELTYTFKINKARLTAAPADVTINAGDALPTEHKLTYTGFVNGEGEDVLTVTGTPTFALKNKDKELTDSNTAGEYTIEWTNKSEVTITADNYEIGKEDGKLIIKATGGVNPGGSGGGSSGGNPGGSTGGSSNGFGGGSFGGSSSSGGSSAKDFAVQIGGEVKNGSIEVSSKSAAKGSTVTVKLTPDEGYILDTLTVTDKDGNEIEIEKTGENTYTFKMPEGEVSVKAVFKEAEPAEEKPTITFTDVPADAYYADAVSWAIEKGITNGTGGTNFSPNKSCTRAEIVTFLWRATGSPEPASTENPFTDVDANSYYGKAVFWAVENGITNGTGGANFSPDDECNRAQAVTFLHRYEKAPASSGANGFDDVAPDAYYADAVNWAVGEAITNGTGGTNFSPENVCTRAQIVTFLYRDIAEQ